MIASHPFGQTLKAGLRLSNTTDSGHRQRLVAFGYLGWFDKSTTVGKNHYGYVYCILTVVNVTSL